MNLSMHKGLLQKRSASSTSTVRVRLGVVQYARRFLKRKNAFHQGYICPKRSLTVSLLSTEQAVAVTVSEHTSSVLTVTQGVVHHVEHSLLYGGALQGTLGVSSQFGVHGFHPHIVHPSYIPPLVLSSSSFFLLVFFTALEFMKDYREPERMYWQDKPRRVQRVLLQGVDITGYELLRTPEAKKATAFAARMHAGQMRKTGDPYITHCIHTARIVCSLVPRNPDDPRALNSVLAAILHDVVDDTPATQEEVEQLFGSEVAAMVAGVTRLSQVNQLLRRKRRVREETGDGYTMSASDAQALRTLVLSIIDDPCVVMIKLADRLHNMRTLYALPHTKRVSVAQETMSLWCSLASCIGFSRLKAELEDLSFAVLQPENFSAVQRELYAMRHRPVEALHPLRANTHRLRFGKRSLAEALPCTQEPSISEDTPFPSTSQYRDAQASAGFDAGRDGPPAGAAASGETAAATTTTTAVVVQARPSGAGEGRGREERKLLEPEPTRERLESVMGFDSDAGAVARAATTSGRELPHAAEAWGELQECKDRLRERLALEGVARGLDVRMSARIKSLHSTFAKMRRKKLRGVEEVYDVLALRVVVDDCGGTEVADAMAVCYAILGLVHATYRPLHGQDVFDDYIVNAKRSGYQSLHTAVEGPGRLPIEIQIRTQTMDDIAEHGAAAHWNYKEVTSAAPTAAPTAAPAPAPASAGPYTPASMAMNSAVDAGHLLKAVMPPAPAPSSTPAPPAPKSAPPLPRAWVGQGALRVDRHGNLRDAVVLSMDSSEAEGSTITVAVRDLVPTIGMRPAPQEKYTELLEAVLEKGWTIPGQGDNHTCIEEYVLCTDGRYHKVDVYGMKLPTCLELLTVSLPGAPPAEPSTRADADASTPTSTSPSSSTSASSDTAAPAEGTSNRGGAAAAAEAPSKWADSKGELGAQANENLTDQEMNDKVRLFRSMLLWEAEIKSAEAEAEAGQLAEHQPPDEPRAQSSDVTVITWPDCVIHRIPGGATARDLKRLRERRLSGAGAATKKVFDWRDAAIYSMLRRPPPPVPSQDPEAINVNNQLVGLDTVLSDGDLVIFRS